MGGECFRRRDAGSVARLQLIPAPAGDAVTFRLHRSRLWLRMTLIFIPVFLLMRGIVIGLSLEEWDLTETVIWVLLTAIAGATGTVLAAGRNLGWIRISAVGLEFAATRRQPVFLPWSAVQSVGLRFTGPLTELLIIPTSLNAATVAAVPHRSSGGSDDLVRRYLDEIGRHRLLDASEEVALGATLAGARSAAGRLADEGDVL